MFDTDKSDKGKGKERDNTTQDVVDLTSDNDDPAPENGGEEREDHNLVKKLLSTMIGWLYGFMQLMSLIRFQKAMARRGPRGNCFPESNSRRSLVRMHWSV